MSGFGLIGRSLPHSRSPRIHSLLGSYDYGLFELEPEALGGFLSACELDGMNVTIPYKRAVLPFCARLSETAERTGSVNTLVRRPEGWCGHNTDYFGFMYTLKHSNVNIRGKKCLVFGSGGASRSVTAALGDMGAREVRVISRSDNGYGSLSKHSDADIIVNATPVGMFPDNGHTPCGLEVFSGLEAVFDLIYNPLRTALLLEAERRGIPAFNGLRMLVAQAAESSRLFTGREVGEDRIEEIYRTVLNEARNIVLIGMPGCGKTAVGALLAERLGREFADADAVFGAERGVSPAEIIRERGEAEFRLLESETLKRLCSRTGLVIATGGGCVTRDENYSLLRENGLVFWLRRDIRLLPDSGRPLSQLHGAERLYEERREKYAAFADFEVENNGAPSQCADSIAGALSGSRADGGIL